MRRFIFQLLALLAIVLGLNGLLHWTLPFDWGDPRLTAKIAGWRALDPEPTTLMIGSSWTYRHLVPEVFDEVLGPRLAGAGGSFNFGIDGVHQPLAGRIYEHLVEERGARPERVLMELARFLSAVDPKLDHGREAKYWRSPELTASMLRFLADRPDKSSARKAVQAVRLGLIQAEAWLHLSHGVGLLEHWTGTAPPSPVLGPRGDGFYAVDRQALDVAGQPLDNRFLRNPDAPAVLARLREECAETLAAPPGPVIDEGLRIVEGLLADAEARGIWLIFWVPPRLCSRYDLVRPIWERIPERHRIAELADAEQHPELFRFDESADRTHFAEAGARRLTRQLAEAVRQRLEEAGPSSGSSRAPGPGGAIGPRVEDEPRARRLPPGTR